MHPETKKLTQTNMPYLTLTLTENLKLQLSPGLVASYNSLMSHERLELTGVTCMSSALTG